MLDDDTLLQLLRAQLEVEEKFRPIEAQNGFGTRYPTPNTFPVQRNTRSGQELIKDASYRIIEELVEANGHLKNRPWKQTERPVDHEAFEEEIADAIHFFLRYLLILFGSPEEVLYHVKRIYFKKAQENHRRHQEGV